MVARKAAWVLARPGGVRALKIKIGRAKWMDSFDAALERDVAVVETARRAVGSGVVLLVDANDGYGQRPSAAADFATALEKKPWRTQASRKATYPSSCGSTQ